ncbi:MAG: hypothetical protein R3A45_03445 [Bdellovibrionota bacterium]
MNRTKHYQQHTTTYSLIIAVLLLSVITTIPKLTFAQVSTAEIQRLYQAGGPIGDYKARQNVHSFADRTWNCEYTGEIHDDHSWLTADDNETKLNLACVENDLADNPPSHQLLNLNVKVHTKGAGAEGAAGNPDSMYKLTCHMWIYYDNDGYPYLTFDQAFKEMNKCIIEEENDSCGGSRSQSATELMTQPIFYSFKEIHLLASLNLILLVKFAPRKERTYFLNFMMLIKKTLRQMLRLIQLQLT